MPATIPRLSANRLARLDRLLRRVLRAPHRQLRRLGRRSARLRRDQLRVPLRRFRLLLQWLVSRLVLQVSAGARVTEIPDISC